MIKQVMATFEKHIPRLEKAITDFPWENKEVYARYLCETYRYVTHSVRLLQYAADKLPKGELKECFLHHIEEEKGHELMAVNDLKRLGYKPEQFAELPITREIYETIYRQIDEMGPAAIVGYALALEGVSARQLPNITKRLLKTYGLKCSSFIKLHGEVDPGHIQESFGILKFFKDDELKDLERVMLESIDRYCRYLNMLCQEAGYKAA